MQKQVGKENGNSKMDTGRYINPYTDFGFKKLFGTEMNKDLLISFLNALFNGKKQEITDVQYLNAEHLGEGYGDRRAVFDVYCMTSDGSRFIVEMQKAEQEYFKDRSIYYSTFAIREQAVKGKQWNYHLDDVYTVGVLNFVFPNGEYPSDSFCHEIKLTDVEDNHVFYDKLTFLYLEMPKFTKTEDELETITILAVCSIVRKPCRTVCFRSFSNRQRSPVTPSRNVGNTSRVKRSTGIITAS